VAAPEISMSAHPQDYLTPEAIELIASARALAPKLAERAAAADRDGRVTKEIVDDIDRAGLFRVLQPRRWGEIGRAHV
jgi:3-hydroxy-9,10-secoandrosta-1,3,5(10)-triene-9,17-dione monooxygenase